LHFPSSPKARDTSSSPQSEVGLERCQQLNKHITIFVTTWEAKYNFDLLTKQISDYRVLPCGVL
jgi:hypothetical protein